MSGSFKCKPGCTCGRHQATRRPQDYRETGFKQCTKCDREKPLAEFDVVRPLKDGTPGYHASCKRCRADVSYAFMRRNTFRYRYGITLDEYEALHRAQGGLCKICGEAEWVIQNGKVRMLGVDHNHVTGKVRGLLCASCNRALGLMKDSADILKKAARYLESEGDYAE